jgi:hypothetical protein
MASLTTRDTLLHLRCFPHRSTGIFSQCTHLTIRSMEAAAQPGMSWARTQVETAADFCETSTLWYILSGGLNLQVGG